jgi:hypothetical protein
VPSVITQSLARMVLPLSTRVVSDHPVSLNAAFFGEWHFSRRILLFILPSSVSLAGCSRSLNPYVFCPNNHVHLASFSEPYSLASMVLRIFHSIPRQSFAFVSIAGVEPAFDLLEGDCFTIKQYCEPTSMCCLSCTIPC